MRTPPGHDNAALFAQREVLELLACPACYQALALRGAGVVCEGCGRLYPVVDGVPVLLLDRAVALPAP